MAKESIPEHDQELVQTATLRAAICGWLNANVGAYGATEIAAAIGADRSRVAHACERLAKDQFIGRQGGGGRGNKIEYFGRAVADDVDQPTKIRRSKNHPAKDVELVMAGVTIVIGRNPSTGRLRIVLEA